MPRCPAERTEDLPTNAPILIITDANCDVPRVRRPPPPRPPRQLGTGVARSAARSRRARLSGVSPAGMDELLALAGAGRSTAFIAEYGSGWRSPLELVFGLLRIEAYVREVVRAVRSLSVSAVEPGFRS
jgi:hypothetical protein